MRSSSSYCVYIVRCADDTLYTGITTELERRIKEHNSPDRGAKYTRTRQPVTLLYYEHFPDRSSASKREYEIKHRMNRKQKLALVQKPL